MLLKARLVRDMMTAFYETIERPLVPVVAAMEREGIKVDRAALAELSRDFARRIADLEQAIFRAVGNDFNIGSTKQLGDVLFEKLGLPGGKKGKTGAYGTDASILEELAPLHEVPRHVLEWRQLTKLKATYADALAEEIDRDSGRVHTSYALAVAATGRFSSNNPNLQNIPIRTEEGRRIRRAFVAEPGHLLLSADYSQIELRLAAHVAEVPELKQAFRDGVDIHALTASQVFGVPLAAMDANTRRRAKAINFGIIYGISAFGLGRSRRAAERGGRLHPRLFRALPGIRAYMERIKTIAAAPAMSRRSSAANASSPGSGTPIPRAAPAPSGRRSTRLCRARPPTSSSAQWPASPPLSRTTGWAPACYCRSMTSCCSRYPRAKSRQPRRSSGRSWRAPARRIANSRCHSSSRPAGREAGTKRIRSLTSARTTCSILNVPVSSAIRSMREPSLGLISLSDNRSLIQESCSLKWICMDRWKSSLLWPSGRDAE